ncbi:MAG TPA: ABC transporter substrate-binding protein [Candidatus Limnocylindrales bacterium]|jgi:putative spermidine/putrescine transport system substrate-binding protein|nr:ABC transporter substrate-binding protein [Candidatus Limnocylindrales bacterium]
MRRLTAFSGFISIAALIGACTGGGGATGAPSGTAAATAAGSGAASGGATGDACNPPRQDGVELTYVSFGGAYQEAQRKAWLTPYTELTGVTFKEDENSSNATIKAQVEAGQVTWDVVDVGNDFGLDAHKDLLEPLDYSLIPRDEVIEGFASDYRVADMTYGVVLAYNTDKTAGQVPAGWADFFDTAKFPGKRGMWDYSEGGIFEVALMADGVKPTELYPLDLERATKKLDTIKNDLVFWGSGAESQELIGSGEVAMTLIWNGRGWSAKHTDNKPVEMQWNQQIVTADYLVVPKGTPNKEAAMRFIAYAVCAENNAKPSEFIPYGPINKNSKPAEANKADLSVSNADENSAYFDDEYLIEHFDEIDAAYQEWKTR